MGLATVVIAVVVVSVVLFIKPAVNTPTRSDAVVVLAGGSDRVAKGVELVKAGYAPNLVVSAPNQEGCPKPVAAVSLTCFQPNPATTQGEARFAASLAARRHWHRIIVVAGTPQITRARIRFERCYHGSLLMVSADPTGVGTWAYEVAYEWAALAKALTMQRGC